MVLSCEDVSLGYEGKPVVERLNFCLEQGDYLCILGENGSGKKYSDESDSGTEKSYAGNACQRRRFESK